LIYEIDSKSFASLMRVTWQSCDRNYPDKETMRYWFAKLNKYEITEVAEAFDKWLLSQKKIPSLNDILGLLHHKVTIHARLPSPLAKAENREQAEKVVQVINQNFKAPKDYKQWARDLISGKTKSNMPNAIEYAKSALGMAV